jgi:hypothetical protein
VLVLGDIELVLGLLALGLQALCRGLFHGDSPKQLNTLIVPTLCVGMQQGMLCVPKA